MRHFDEECQRIREAEPEAARRGELAERCSLTFCRSMKLQPGNLMISEVGKGSGARLGDDDLRVKNGC